MLMMTLPIGLGLLPITMDCPFSSFSRAYFGLPQEKSELASIWLVWSQGSRRTVAGRIWPKMKTWQNLQAFQDALSLLQRIIEDCRLETYYAAESMGDQAWTNLLKLVALSKEASGYPFLWYSRMSSVFSSTGQWRERGSNWLCLPKDKMPCA